VQSADCRVLTADSAAAVGGHLEVLQWLRSQDLPGDGNNSQFVAEINDLY
jgi:hypothetical protein